jgi:hypothetical protein
MTHPPRRLDAVRAQGAFHVEHCDVPVDMTLQEWRRACAEERRAEEPAPRGRWMWRTVRRVFGG